jgi:hypothetical protein
MGDAMNPLSPEQILRNLEHGYFMTHQEQAETAQYIRELQQENLTLLGKREWVGLTQAEINLIYAEPQTHVGQYARAIEEALRKKNERN